ncbi:hypothetical protein F5Y05DRAFT_19277 [Hypoxylon sp. FL0543]|nr:hypothetical protein F5Y05DRAFT_19277 [Hypoxylon sp. FL0543]
MPPHSLCEWIAGRNIRAGDRKPRPRRPAPPAQPAPPVPLAPTAPQAPQVRQGPRQIFSVDFQTDDESEADILKVTYPRAGRIKTKQVRFAEDAQKKGAKRAVLRFPAGSDADLDIMVGTPSCDESTTGGEPDSDHVCANCAAARRKPNKSAMKSEKENNQSSADDSDGSTASGRTKQKAKKAKADSSKQQAKPKAIKGKDVSESEVETTDATTDATQTGTEPETDVEATEAETEEGTGGETTEVGTTEGETEAESEAEKEALKNKGNKGNQNKQDSQSKKGKQASENKQVIKQNNQGKKGNQGNQGKQNVTNSQNAQKKQEKPQNSPVKKGKEDKGASEKEVPLDGFGMSSTFETARAGAAKIKDTKSKKDKKTKKAKEKAREHPPHNPPPENSQGNILLPPQSRLVQLEHAVEVPHDPRPNAFFDNSIGVARVYHGPAYGNPYGTLYPNTIYANQNLAIGTPHPSQNPWYNGFAPAPGGPMHFHGPAQQPQQPQTFQPAQPGQPGQPAPPAGPPQPAQPPANHWYQGSGHVTVGAPPENAGVSPFAADFNQQQYEEFVKQYSTSPTAPAKPTHTKPKNSDRGGRSNVVPTVEDPGPEEERSRQASGSKRQESQNGSNGGNDKDTPSGDKTSTVRSSIQETIEKDTAKAKARAHRDGARFSKEPPATSASPAFVPFNGSTHGSPSANNQWSNNAYSNYRRGYTGTNNANVFESGSGGNTGFGGGESANNGNGNHSEKSHNGSRAGSRRDSISRMTPPGAWVPTPASPESTRSKPHRNSPDNVGGNWNGSNKGKSPSPPVNGQGNANQYQNGGTSWQDFGAAQSSGGVFEENNNLKTDIPFYVNDGGNSTQW